MKYYSFNTYSYKENGDIDPCIATYSEREILNMYCNHWKKQLIEKFGKEHFEANFSEKDCIEDWKIIYLAWETTVDVPQETINHVVL
jgi:hypothetical protein